MEEMHRRSADLNIQRKGLGEEAVYSSADSIGLRPWRVNCGYAHVRLDGTVVHGSSISKDEVIYTFYPCIVVRVGSSRPLVGFIRVRAV